MWGYSRTVLAFLRRAAEKRNFEVRWDFSGSRLGYTGCPQLACSPGPDAKAH